MGSKLRMTEGLRVHVCVCMRVCVSMCTNKESESDRERMTEVAGGERERETEIGKQREHRLRKRH